MVIKINETKFKKILYIYLHDHLNNRKEKLNGAGHDT